MADFGNTLKVSVFGQSHGKAIGVLIDGLPAGEHIDRAELQNFLDRRRPGKNRLSTARNEMDAPVFLSGILDDVTCGAPICAIIENNDQRSSDYTELFDKPRPSHADYTAWVKWGGKADLRGGGQFSGRLTAALCIAGGIAKQILARHRIFIGAHLSSIGTEHDEAFPLFPTKELFDQVAAKAFPVINDQAGECMQKRILSAAAEADSVGGIIECAVIGLPAGLGNAMSGGMESRLAAAIFGIPAIKGIEFGAGFKSTEMPGSDNNDAFYIDNNADIKTSTNHSGGILGGITNGMPLTLRAAVKPTPSIGKLQKTVSLSKMQPEEIKIKGRHDPCIAHRAVPVIEAVTAIIILDIILEEN